MIHLKSVRLKSEDFPTNQKYPYTLDVVQNTGKITFDKTVTIFAGENGTGKSTILEAATIACGIHIWRAAEKSRYTYNPYEKSLARYLELEWADEKVEGSYFGSDIFHNFVESLDNWASMDPGQLDYFGGKSLMEQSHGQSLMSFFASRYKLKGLYMLDEPETALSPATQLELLKIITEASKSGLAQFIIATHSPILLACPNADIYNFDALPLEKIEYEECGHYKLYRDFMRDRENFLK